jgi:hypothetical protein
MATSALLSLALAVIGASSADSVPQSLAPVPGSDQHEWLAIDLVSPNQEGENALAPLDLRWLTEDVLQTPVDPAAGCVPLGPVFRSYVNSPQPDSLGDQLRAAGTALVGTIVSSKVGLRYHEFGQLFLVRPQERLKGTETGDILVFYPQADFELEGRRYCKRDPRWTDLKVGDNVLVMIEDGWFDAATGLVQRARPFSVGRIGDDGSVTLGAEVGSGIRSSMGTVLTADGRRPR